MCRTEPLLNFEHLRFEFVQDLDIRIWDFSSFQEILPTTVPQYFLAILAYYQDMCQGDD